MLEFSIGDRVTFEPPGYRVLEGILTRYNKKTATVITGDGGQWNVSPNYLRQTSPKSAGRRGRQRNSSGNRYLTAPLPYRFDAAHAPRVALFRA